MTYALPLYPILCILVDVFLLFPENLFLLLQVRDLLLLLFILILFLLLKLLVELLMLLDGLRGLLRVVLYHVAQLLLLTLMHATALVHLLLQLLLLLLALGKLRLQIAY